MSETNTNDKTKVVGKKINDRIYIDVYDFLLWLTISGCKTIERQDIINELKKVVDAFDEH